MKQVFIDEDWVVKKYLEMEKSKSWGELDSPDDMRVLELERELMAENDGVRGENLPAIDDEELST